MHRRLLRKLRYKILRAMVRTRKTTKNLGPKEDLDETQKLSVSIIRKLATMPGADIMLLPVGGIDNSTKLCYVEYGDVVAKIFPSNRVQLINGKYFYEVYLPTASYDEIRTFLFQRMQMRRNSLERKISVKTERSLKDILLELEDQ